MVALGSRHFAELHADVVRQFCCVFCGYESVAMIRASGFGDAASPLFLGEDQAREEAVSFAASQLEQHADLLVSIARCTQCGQRDDEAWARAQRARTRRALKNGAALAALFGIPLLFLDGSPSSDWPLALAVAVVAFIVGVLVARLSRAQAINPSLVYVLNAKELHTLATKPRPAAS